MEEPKTSKSENHEPKKNIICEESKAVKIITNQTLKPRNDKSMTEIGISSLNRNSNKKTKQNDICIEKTEVKSCKVNAASIPGPKDLGLVLRDQSHCKVKKIPNSPMKAQKGSSQTKVEKAPSLQAKAEKLTKSTNLPVKAEKATCTATAATTEKALNSQKKEENISTSQMKLQKAPSSPLEPENEPSLLLKENMKQTESQQTGKKLINYVVSVDKRNSEALQGEKSTLENLSPSQRQQTRTDNIGDSDDSASGIDDTSDDLSKYKYTWCFLQVTFWAGFSYSCSVGYFWFSYFNFKKLKTKR